MLDKVLTAVGAVIAVGVAGAVTTKVYLGLKKERILTDAVQRNAAHAIKDGEDSLAEAHRANERHRKDWEERMLNLKYQEEASTKAHEARMEELHRASEAAMASLEEVMSNKKPKPPAPRKPRNTRSAHTPPNEE